MNYYNENNPAAAEWIRTLIAAGEVPRGEVDERSIVEVKANELTGYTQCHFFAGIAGWSLALRWAGWPETKPVWTGSCPCQPFSCAGKRKGHADERHLWPAFHALIAKCSPAIIFGEQVASPDGREWLAGVRADLEGTGYAVGGSNLCAAGVGAPHKRQRLFWVGVSNRAGWQPRQSSAEAARYGRPAEPAGGAHAMENSEHAEWRPKHGPVENGCNGQDARWQETHGEPRTRGAIRAVGDTQSDGREMRPQLHGELRGEGSGEGCEPRRMADADGRLAGDGGVQRGGGHMQLAADEGTGGMGNAKSGGCGIVGDATRSGRGGHAERTGWSRFTTVLCRDGKTRRFEPESFPLAHGVPNRVGLLRGYGNAIVPQLAAEFIQAACESFR